MATSLPNRALMGAASIKSGDELRETAYRILERSFRRAEQQRKGGGLGLYAESMRTLRDICRERWILSTVFAEEAGLVRRFYQDTGLALADSAVALGDSVLGNVWARAWTATLLRLDKAGFNSVCRASGEQHLREAKAAGRGVILVHRHNLFSQLFWRWLEHQGVDAGVTLRQWTWGKGDADVKDKKTSTLEGARELYTGMQTLKRGGMLHVLADGHQGGSHYLTLPFFNRQRPFRRTFAELAVSSGSPVLPVDLTLRDRGGIALEIGVPMADTGAVGDKQARIESMVRAYADNLGHRWKEHPADIPWAQMRWHLRYPSI